MKKTVGADGRERKRPAKKSKPISEPKRTAPPQDPEPAKPPEPDFGLEKEVNTEKAIGDPQGEAARLAKVDFAENLHAHFNALWALCEPTSNWPDLNAQRQRRRRNALGKLRTIWRDLVAIATPSPVRKPKKGAAR